MVNHRTGKRMLVGNLKILTKTVWRMTIILLITFMSNMPLVMYPMKMMEKLVKKWILERMVRLIYQCDEKRRVKKRASRIRSLRRAKEALQAEIFGSMKWQNTRPIEIVPAAGVCFDALWKFEQFIRAYTAPLLI